MLYIFVLVIALSVLGVPMTIIAVIGAAGLAIGLALQNSLSNIAGGFIILFSKPFKVGDLSKLMKYPARSIPSIYYIHVY